MTKRTKIVYVYLALFAFVLGFSFTQASQAQANGLICCSVQECEGYPNLIRYGHMAYDPELCIFRCVSQPLTSCGDFSPICPENP